MVGKVSFTLLILVFAVTGPKRVPLRYQHGMKCWLFKGDTLATWFPLQSFYKTITCILQEFSEKALETRVYEEIPETPVAAGEARPAGQADGEQQEAL
ncbi:unnamed protein product [Caretta caretta]